MAIAGRNPIPVAFTVSKMTAPSATMFRTVHARFAPIGDRFASGHMTRAFIGGK